VLTFLVLNGAALLTGLFVACALGARARTSLFALCTLCAFLGVVHSAVLVTGLIGWLTVGGLGLCMGLAVIGGWWLARRATPAAAAADETVTLTPATAFAPLLAILCGVLWAWPHLLEGTRLWIWDDYTYHAVYPTLWLREHAIAAVTPPQAFTMQAWFPLSASAVSTWFMAPFAASRADALAWVSLTGVLYVGIVACAAAELLTRLGCRRGAWAVPVGLVVTSERIGVMASSFSDADLAHATTLFAALVFATPRGDVEDAPEMATDTAFAALLSGLAIGVKTSAVPVALVVLMMMMLRARSRHSGGSVLYIFAIAWVATGAYWYARNVVHTGNPLYPAAFLFWPGTTFSQTTLREYGHQYGLARAVSDSLVVYLNWPRLHGVLAIVGLVGLTAWLGARRSMTTRPQTYFACAALAVTALVLVLLPVTPYSAGNPMTFASGVIHWDSMRYIALLPMLGWAALGFLVDAGAGAPHWRTALAGIVVSAGLLAAGYSRYLAVSILLAAIVLATIVALAPRRLPGGRPARVAGAAVVVGLAGIVIAGHGAKAGATAEALYRERLFGPAAAVLDRQPAGTRVAIFGDQWVYPTFGARHHLVPVRLDGDGRLATAPIGSAFTPGPLTVHPWTFRANLATSRVGIVVVLHLPHPGRSPQWPTQAAALETIGDARVLFRTAWVGIWKLD
jgi:hypothetical protein